jgi:hypothetical protein
MSEQAKPVLSNALEREPNPPPKSPSVPVWTPKPNKGVKA